MLGRVSMVGWLRMRSRSHAHGRAQKRKASGSNGHSKDFWRLCYFFVCCLLLSKSILVRMRGRIIEELAGKCSEGSAMVGIDLHVLYFGSGNCEEASYETTLDLHVCTGSSATCNLI